MSFTWLPVTWILRENSSTWNWWCVGLIFQCKRYVYCEIFMSAHRSVVELYATVVNYSWFLLKSTNDLKRNTVRLNYKFKLLSHWLGLDPNKWYQNKIIGLNFSGDAEGDCRFMGASVFHVTRCHVDTIERPVHMTSMRCWANLTIYTICALRTPYVCPPLNSGVLRYCYMNYNWFP